MLKLVVEKSTARIVFACRPQPLMVDSVFSLVTHTIVNWRGAVPESFTLATCWNWTVAGTNILAQPIADPAASAGYALRQAQGDALQVLVRALTRHRMATNPQLLGQDLLYAAKTVQAKQVAANPSVPVDTVPLVADYATLVGITVAQAAAQILLKHRQQIRVLQDTEAERQRFAKRIAAAANVDEVKAIIVDIGTYERTA